MQVVLLVPTYSHNDLKEVAKATPALHVRGKVVVRWARYLAAVLRDKGIEVPGTQQTVVDDYERLDGPPRSLRNNAIVARTEEEAEVAVETLMQGREGYSNVGAYGAIQQELLAEAAEAATAAAAAGGGLVADGSDGDGDVAMPPADPESSTMDGLAEVELQLDATWHPCESGGGRIRCRARAYLWHSYCMPGLLCRRPSLSRCGEKS